MREPVVFKQHLPYPVYERPGISLQRGEIKSKPIRDLAARGLLRPFLFVRVHVRKRTVINCVPVPSPIKAVIRPWLARCGTVLAYE